MPKYRLADLPNVLRLRVPLEVLARGDRQMSDAAVEVRVATALHEAAHFVAAHYCRAAVTSLQIAPAGEGARSGVIGRVQVCAWLPDEDALISFVGYAWEELHGGVMAHAEQDLQKGNRLADEAEQPRGKLLDEARWLVREGDGLIRAAAAGILATMPKSGVLRGRTLRHLNDWFYCVDVQEARASVGARVRAQAEPRANVTRIRRS